MSNITQRSLSRACFGLFFVSGFCGLLYQTVWTRLAFASFGVITPVLSVIVSVFMLGLALGSWLAGKYVNALTSRFRQPAIVFYGFAELLVGICAVIIPYLFSLARHSLLSVGALNSNSYLLTSGACIAAILLLPCIGMGATFPLMMSFMHSHDEHNQDSFSYLYLGNCIGAMIGTLATAFVLIELFGFNATLMVGAAGNLFIACTSFVIGRNYGFIERAESAPAETSNKTSSMSLSRLALLILFWTGFASMAMEVVWVRAFLYTLGHEVYSFAQLLAAYLLGMCAGSFYYRRTAARMNSRLSVLVALLGGCCLYPLILNDIILRSQMSIIGSQLLSALHIAQASPDSLLDRISPAMALISVIPCSALYGYLTPKIIDRFGEGRADLAGSLYAVNTLGCIVGPLVASYLLLPLFGVKVALIILSVPMIFAVIKLLPCKPIYEKLFAASLATIMLISLFATTYEDLPTRYFKPCQLFRDYTATVISFGNGFDRRLLVNGSSVTKLDQCTKNIGHFPLIAFQHKPQSALVICFGMGTTFRSLLSWGIDVTAVEIAPSVVKSFGFFFDDAAQVLGKPNAHVVIDDGRRFLQRTDQTFDVVSIDPAPVMDQSGMSLLFTSEFMQLVKRHLKPGGIFELFVGNFDKRTTQAIVRSMIETFPHVRMFDAPGAGIYCLCSDQPLVLPADAEAMLSKMPPAAFSDLTEWLPNDPRGMAMRHLDYILSCELDVNKLLSADEAVRLTDDRPYNEYYFVRHLLNGRVYNFEPAYLHQQH